MSKRSKWRLRLTVSYVQEVVVDAYGYVDAIDEAEQLRPTLDPDRCTYRAEPLERLGEPWAVVGWYDLHGPGDVVLCSRSFGNVFTEQEVELLQNRLTSLGLEVTERWNGTGFGSVSFRCKGRLGTEPFTEQEVRDLCAPRKEGK
jgi:hypothetical protein